MNRGPLKKRLMLTEDAVNSDFMVRYKLGNAQRKSSNMGMPEDEGWPQARILFGGRTNLSSEVQSDSKMTIDEVSPLHMTVEYCEKNSSLRFARTFFLNTLGEESYMEGCTRFDPSKDGAT